ncbi:calmodulin-binding protein Sha1 [Aspergillus avenaceus]|uniref:Calmodulin-binding protein Sha1 n=1 Tax=Aspergillus avenaceus TaxID=36643 RepID=A0A5N6U3J5_ASPAV|nr:calmodulin-binding protein Sha1 [Aspergillus avenaceus]
MSGFMSEFGTPCPSRSPRRNWSSGGNTSSSSFWEGSSGCDDDTANIEFTTEIKAPLLTGVKPRRRTKTGASFLIHDEDENHASQPKLTRKRDISVAAAAPKRKTSLLAQPAQRFRPKVSFGASPVENARRGESEQRRQTAVNTEKNRDLLMKINGNRQEVQSSDVVKRGVHRSTVYISPNDNPAANMPLGVVSPLKTNRAQARNPDNAEISNQEIQAARRQAKRSLAASAQRVPLQPSIKVKQESRVHVDRIGKNGGKENIPPGTVLESKDKSSQPLGMKSDLEYKTGANSPVTAKQRQTTTKSTHPLTTRSTNTCMRRPVMGERTTNTRAPATLRGEADVVAKRATDVNRSSAASKASHKPDTSRQSVISANPQKTASRAKTSHATEEYPLIPEALANPALYDEDWLSNQEAVITQLANGLFDHVESSSIIKDPVALRHELCALYQDPSITHLHQRIKASLLYGAMSLPKDVLARNNRLRQDVGMKQKFLRFWTQIYDPHALRATLEAVTGRMFPDNKPAARSVQASSGVASDTEKGLKRRLETFLDAVLLQDVGESNGQDATGAERAHLRTVLRSIMVIVLLDKAKTSSETALPRCLFLPSSPYKSSAAVLRGLARFLLSTSGDIIKSLGHLDYHPQYEQCPLHEYDYQMSNLAVDLRDGVRLTRMAEILLHPTMQTNTGNECWPISHRLKLPCLSRAVRLFNVRTALDALARSDSFRDLANGVRAEDIVDGHREKTIALLWGLVSKWGLTGMINLGDLRNEIVRLKEKAISQYGYDSVQGEDWFRSGNVDGLGDDGNTTTLLLQHWASILSYLKGLRVENLNSCFDGKVFESIVHEYESYITPDGNADGRVKSSLQSRLEALGCSSQLAHLVSPDSSRPCMFDDGFTVGALAFLCSRLLSVSKRARAAAVLQRAWRRTLARRDLHRRTVARDVARQCASIVQTRDRILWAKETIVQWWRTRAKPRRNPPGNRHHLMSNRDCLRG